MATLTEIVKFSKQVLGEKVPCSIEILSPVHIGSGIRLVEGWDFIYRNGILKIVNQEEILPKLSEKQLNEFNNDNRRRDILARAESRRTYTLNYERGEVLEFERNGNGIPYIPGSSFKGAIRTALFVSEYNKDKATFDKILHHINLDNRVKRERASEHLLERVFGKKPNFNTMRLLQPSDIYFSQDAVEVSEVKILSLSSREANSFNYKNFSLYPEHLKIGSKGNFSLKIDEFLFKNPKAKEKLKFENLSFSDIVKAVNTQSKIHLEKEIAFFEKCGQESLKEIIEFNKALLSVINLESDNEFILRISWGSGWKGMTGDYLDENWLKTFRTKFNLGKRDFPIFPKTRRIVFKDGKPRFTLGWVLVKINYTFPENELTNFTLSLQGLKEVVQPKVIRPKPQGAVEAVVISTEPPKAKVEILEGKYKGTISELSMPLANLSNLGIKQGTEIYVTINEQRDKVQSVQFKGLKT
jgi:CRISPR-associated protein Csm5